MMRSQLSRVVLSFAGAGALALLAMNCGGSDDSTGGAGTGGGSAGTGGGACDVPALFTAKSCAISACHGSAKSGGLDMQTAGWETRLVGKASGGAPATGGPASKCGTTHVYLVAGSNPATGLFLDKLKPNPPCGERMPNLLGMELSTAEIACVQTWANNLTK